jgi:hypothetical protein
MSLSSRDTILIWFGGVITELVAEITLQSLQSGRDIRGFFPQRVELKQLADELSLGLISPLSYCERVIKTTNSRIDAKTLEELILGGAALNNTVINLIDSIPDKFEKWLISDYPESWFQVISSREDYLAKFSRDRIIFTTQSKLKDMVPLIFNFVVQASGHSLEECILIDSISSRAVEAVRQGLSAIIYVYPDKLEHEFALRGILKTEQEVLHPQSSSRVDL